jgi:hypothetical protein
MTNKPSFDDVLAIARELGTASGKGKDTQAKLMLQTLEGSYLGVLDLKHNKHGADIDDAGKIAMEYVTASTGNAPLDTKSPKHSKVASCVRAMVRFGAWPKGGVGEPINTTNELLARRAKHKANPAVAKTLYDAQNCILNYARAQMKIDHLIPEDQLDQFLFRPQPDDMSAADIIAATVKRLDKLIDGSASHGTAQDKSPEIINARDSLRKRLGTYKTTP